MYMGKLIGAILTFTSIMIITLNLHFKSHYQLQEIKEFKKAMIIFYSYMEFSTLPLPFIFHELAKKTENNPKKLFTNITNMLNQNKIKDINTIWCTSISQISFIACECKEVLKDIGSILGILDKQLQLKNIDLAIKELNYREELCMEKIKKNSSLYLRMGVMVGILIIVLFI